MARNVKQTATVNEAIRLEAISFNQSHCLAKVKRFFLIEDSGILLAADSPTVLSDYELKQQAYDCCSK